MISPTAAAPGAKAGTSKELNALKRKVLERNNMPASYLNDVPAAINAPGAPPARAATKRKAEAMQLIDGEETVVTGEESLERQQLSRKSSNTVVRKKKIAKELKPGLL